MRSSGRLVQVYANRAMGSRSQVTDPPRMDVHGGGGGGWAWLVTASGIIEAQLIRGVVEDAGVTPVWLDTFDPSPGAWMFMSGDPNAPVPIFVPLAMLDTARIALMESGFAPGDPDDAEPEPSERAARAPTWTGWWRIGIALAVIAIIVVLIASGRASVTS
jgi:hypothetical protein